MSTKVKPCIVTVTLGKRRPNEVHNIKDAKDCAVVFDNVLEVRTENTHFYYPLDSVVKWRIDYEDAPVKKLRQVLKVDSPPSEPDA